MLRDPLIKCTRKYFLLTHQPSQQQQDLALLRHLYVLLPCQNCHDYFENAFPGSTENQKF